MFEVFVTIIIIILVIGFFCTYLHMHIDIFNCPSYLVLVFMISISFRRWPVLHGVFHSFTDHPYDNAFVFITYLKFLAIKL